MTLEHKILFLGSPRVIDARVNKGSFGRNWRGDDNRCDDIVGYVSFLLFTEDVRRGKAKEAVLPFRVRKTEDGDI